MTPLPLLLMVLVVVLVVLIYLVFFVFVALQLPIILSAMVVVVAWLAGEWPARFQENVRGAGLPCVFGCFAARYVTVRQ